MAHGVRHAIARGPAATAAALCLLTLACGSTVETNGSLRTVSPTTAAPAAAVEWERRALGDGPADGAVVGGVANGNLVVVHGAEGRLVSRVSSGGEFVGYDTPVDTTATVSVFDLATFAGSTVLVGSDVETFAPRVWTSTDGSAWAEVTTTGLDQPADLVAVSADADALYAAGLLREGSEPAVGRFRPAIWRSTDGRHWESVTPPGTGADGYASDLIARPGSVIVSLQSHDGGSIWRSADGGATWSPATVEVGSENPRWAVESIAGLGEQLVAVGWAQGDTGGALLILVSSDDGVTWTSAPGSEAMPSGDRLGARVVTAAGAFWISTSEFNSGFSNPEVCYRDLDACRNGARPVLLRSTDGLVWVEIDLAPLTTSWIDRVVDVGGEGMMLVGRTGRSGGLETWTWMSTGEPPHRPPPDAAPIDEVPVAAFDEELSVGATYRFPLFIHCGMGLLGNFNDRWWYLVEGSSAWDPETGSAAAPPAHWPIAQESIFGMITLVDADTIEYTIPSGEVIAVYEASTTEPQLCA
jgi:hypothetical protein